MNDTFVSLTGVLASHKDVDKKILQKLEDIDLFSMILTNKYLYNLTDDVFWRNRLSIKYPNTISYKPDEQNWKRYYLNVVYYIDNLRKEKEFIYTQGDPFIIYNFLFKRIYVTSLEDNIRYIINEKYEDVLLHYVNTIRKMFNNTPFVLGTPAWKHYLLQVESIY